MLVTTAGTLLFGVLGATLAAPITAAALRTINLLRDTGLLGVLTTPSAAAVDLLSPQGESEASAGPAAAK